MRGTFCLELSLGRFALGDMSGAICLERFMTFNRGILSELFCIGGVLSGEFW